MVKKNLSNVVKLLTKIVITVLLFEKVNVEGNLMCNGYIIIMGCCPTDPNIFG